MSIASEITALNTNLTAAKNAVVTKGGTVGDTGLAGLAAEIESIPGGGALPQPSYGRVWYGDYVWTAEDAEECTVEVDVEKFTAYLRTNPLMMGDSANFDYNAGEQTWSSWGFRAPVSGLTSEQLAEQLGITVTVNEGAEWAMFSLSSSPDFSDLKYAEFQSLAEYNSFANGEYDPISINGGTLERGQIRKYEFGSVPTAIPNYCLSNCNKLISITEVPEGVVSIGNDFLRRSGVYPDGVGRILLPSTLRTIGDNFLQGGSVTKYPVNIPNGVTSIGVDGMNGGNSGGIFREPVSFPATLTSVGGGFLNNSINFNQMIVLPESLTVLENWFNTMPQFNQPIYLPQTLTKIKGGFRGFNKMTSTIYVGNLSPSIVESETYDNFLTAGNTSYPAYTQGIKIIGANRQAWLNAFPNRTSTFQLNGRKLVDGGY